MQRHCEEPEGRRGNLFFTIPAVSAKFLMWQAGAVQHVVESVEAQTCKVQLFSDFFYHLCVFWSVRVAIFCKCFFAYIFAFKVADDAAGNQIHLAL